MKKGLAVIAAALLMMLFAANVFAAGEEEPNESANMATAVKLDENVTGALSKSGDQDWYSFTLTAPGSISVDFRHEMMETTATYWRITLYYSDARELCYFYSKGDETLVSSPTVGFGAGTYYVRVSSSSSFKDTAYRLQVNYKKADNWEQEKNVSANDANPVTLNKTWNGSIYNGSDVDWYSFTLSKAGVVSLDFMHEQLEVTSTCWNVRFYAADGKTVYYYLYSRGDEESVSGPKMGLPKGTYYLEVRPSTTRTIPYQFKVGFTASGTWEKEANKSANLATPITLNKTWNGSICSSSDVDWYSFKVKKTTRITIIFDHDNNGKTSTNWAVALYQPNGSSTVSGSSTLYVKGDAERSVSKPVQLTAGTYYVRVTPSTTDTTPYRIRLTDFPFEDVSPEDSYYDAVSWAYYSGIVKGRSASLFAPNDDLSRGEFCTMLWRMYGKPTVSAGDISSMPFADAKASNHKQGIAWCYKQGIINGYKENGKQVFKPGNSISRGSILVMLFKLAKQQKDYQPATISNPFKDVKTTSSSYPAYRWAYQYGVTTARTLNANKNCSRAIMVTYLYGFNNNYHVVK